MTTQTLTSEELGELLKKERKLGYLNGYNAGKARKQLDNVAEVALKRKQAFIDRAFLSALPFAMTQTTWKTGEDPIATVDQRVSFAWLVAESSWRNRKWRTKSA